MSAAPELGRKEVALEAFHPILRAMLLSRLTHLITLLALALAVWSVYALESARAPVTIDRVNLNGTPATFYATGQPTGALVIVAHGFGGSRQMMEAISLSLAHAGHTVVAFDFIGHGRHANPLSPAIGTLTGTTQDLVNQTLAVAVHAKRRTGLMEVSFVGHSMATDVIVRAARQLETAQSVVAISMYSDAVTPSHPDRLLVVSGAFETRLRQVALKAVAQIAPVQEGETASLGDVARRAVSAPWVGHVGVLWSPLTLSEVTHWLGRPAEPVATGKWIVVLLISILILFRALARGLPVTATQRPAHPRRAAFAASVAAIGAGGAAITGLPAMGLAGFGALGLAFGVWGVLVLLILRCPVRFTYPDLFSGLLLIAWGLGVFAIALDRYGAAFVPTGPRLSLALILVPATLAFGLAERILVHGRGLLARVVLRIPFLVAIILAMILSPTELGLTFTVLPVLVLFGVVYGTMAMWVANRTGPVGAGIASGMILSWAISASTPLFMA